MVFKVSTIATLKRFSRRANSSPTPQTTTEDFDRQLKSSPRAWIRKAKSSSPLYSSEHPHLQALATSTHEVDGAWWCEICNFENHLVHRVGPHPFARLQCGRCDHIFDNEYSSTQILGRYIATGPGQVGVPAFKEHDLVPYGMICPDCGLSHRAMKPTRRRLGSRKSVVDFAGVICQCGKMGSQQWYRFSIGDNHDWTGDHAQCYGRVLKQRLKRSTS